MGVKTWTVHHEKMETLGENKQISDVFKSRTSKKTENWLILFLLSNFYGVIMKMLNGCSCGYRSWYQMVDGRDATWSCSLSITLPRLAWVSARNMSSKSWSDSMGTSTPWLGLVSILLRRLAQAGTRSPDSASLYCEDTLVTTCSAQGNGKLLGALIYLYIISRSPVSVWMSFEWCECRFASLQADNPLLSEARVEIGTA